MRKLIALLAVACVAGACDKSEAADTGNAAKSEAAGGEDAEAKEAQDLANLPKAEEILAKAVEAVGGQAKLDDVKSFYYEGEITILGQNIAGRIKIWWKDGDFFTTQDMVGIGQIRAGKQGATIWSDDPINGLRKLEGAEAEQHTWASSLMLAADWKRYFTKAQTIEETTVGGKKAHVVQLTSGTGATVKMAFEVKSGLQLSQEFEQVTPMGKMPVGVEMDDYREIEGIQIPFKQITDASLAKATQTITKIEINAEVDPAMFAFPEKGAEVVQIPPESKEDKEKMMPFDEEGKPGKAVPDEKK